MKTCQTSESVTCGHPDKLCDQIADSILDAVLQQDEQAHVACEAAVKGNRVHIMGEISAQAQVDYESITRRVIAHAGYAGTELPFNADTCSIDVDITEQSPDIAAGLRHTDRLDSGAGDQGMVFGYACRESKNLMPLSLELAHGLARRLAYVRRKGILPYLLADGKTQVTVEYENQVPKRIAAVIISAQHRENIPLDQLREDIARLVAAPVLPADLLDDEMELFVNPAGRFVFGGPAADSGLTGRKPMVDTYGGAARYGGGSLSGKDATKTDRSGAYAARYLAKNVVAAGLAGRCEVALSYAIGLSEPISIQTETFGTETVPVEQIQRLVETAVDLRPAAIIRRFGLQWPIYAPLACYGHFGENARGMPWEETDLAQQWRMQGNASGQESFKE
jgi:S-adenosylmethionine synthetase